MEIANVFTVIAFVFCALVLLVLIITVINLYFIDQRQKQHPVLRNYPVVGRARYFLETIGPELRQYLFNNDNEGKPLSREQYEHIVKKAKYKRDVIGFGSKRDFEEAGYYIRNSMFPKITEELKMDRETKVTTNRYLLVKEPLFTRRKEHFEQDESIAYLLDDSDAIVIGRNVKQPFIVKGQIGMSAMSYGSLGERAVTALSEGLGMAKGTWMNTGEGGLSEYHLKGGVDIIMQIGPGLFGVRDKAGNFSWDALLEKSKIPEIKAFELKLAQGAKTRGGHIDAEKVTEEIAKIRMVEPFKSIDSPNRFIEFTNFPSLFDFVERIREHTGKPVGIKVVIGSRHEADELAKQMKLTGKGPDFITVDGGEGGTGATYQELADSVGLPIKSALPLLDHALLQHGVRDRVKIIASGKLFSPDRVAVALAMGADLVNIARGFMITVGCIQALKCHSNACPVGVTTTDPFLQKALVIDEKKHRTANYVIAMREGLFRLAAAAGLDSPVHFRSEHVVYKDEKGKTWSLEDIYQMIVKEEVAK
ncbi:FMN-binding glutamate synthase family protein [Schinkia azotoformans]|uniref:Putative flavoenzyme n=1 Tax=Schinkia azotoformans LMG 9581 TaxID=1131731 RepID=K6ECF8_SCHAZ|nr:FMN-binding glutamate synthase family protein [Schinkia azotoformans]EKN71121.1 putative flavoenzyme [Schinkia azotoformans LMG 9581]MEC1640350.1 FMN-binding glutamate synthase family protein [Schinkia azotoformans]MEC1722058.1 FMN-binding glutamate synthase family protein [Schinkia azotoformans]MEC1947412.1 FMN-binding glutamate synthase family protein [Schinkia azotoformans]MED4354198.1 FMN-binding glutamate synthase family protein [Schinkia azotoformans]